ncbi:MAG: efflux RND transporter periplasmic adaptor subunit [Geminicoccaceae bacterium]
MRLGTQVAIAGLLMVVLGAGGFVYHRSQADSEAEAAIGRGSSAVPVEIAAAAAGIMRERIEAVGTTIARQAVNIVSLTSGRVVEIAFSPGARVETGAVLVRLDDAAERAAVAEAQAAQREAELTLDRAKKLRANNTVAQATVDELQAAYLGASARVDGARKQLTDRTVRAPFPGVVGIREVDVGARVDDETVLTTLDDLTEVEIEFSVPEIYFGRVREGQTVSATSSAFPGRTFTGRIATIDTRIEQVSRAFRVRAVIPNPDLALPAGMFMHVEVVLEERPAVLIPEEAVIAEGDGAFVFTVEDERARRRPVRLGQRTAGTVEVLEGLEAGEPVVREGMQRLRDGIGVLLPEQPTDGAGSEPQGQGA